MSIKIIGVTGPSGAGKSLLSKYADKTVTKVIDADGVYHSLLVAGSECTMALTKEFGSQILDVNGAPDRKKLGAIVFSDPEKLDKLNSIVLFTVIREIKKIIASYEAEGYKNVIVDAPTLIESGFSDECDVVISVLAPRKDRIARICARDSISKECAEQRINAQKDDGFYISHSHRVLTNDGGTEAFADKVKILLDEILIK